MSSTVSVLLPPNHVISGVDVPPLTAVKLYLIYRTARPKSSLELEIFISACVRHYIEFIYFFLK